MNPEPLSQRIAKALLLEPQTAAELTFMLDSDIHIVVRSLMQMRMRKLISFNDECLKSCGNQFPIPVYFLTTKGQDMARSKLL